MIKIKIITITGEENCGKTSLVKYLFELLKQMGAEVIFYKLVGAHFEDFITILMLKGKLIAICSLGDAAYDDEKYVSKTGYIEQCYEELFNCYSNSNLYAKIDYFINVKNYDIEDIAFKAVLKKICKAEMYIPILCEKNKDGPFQTMYQKQLICEKILTMLK